MKINFLVNQVFDGWLPTDTRLGGTEESIVEWSKELHSRGHTVCVYMNARDNKYGEYNDVSYLPRETYNGGGDVCINIKSSDISPVEPTLYLTNETNAHEIDLSRYDGVIFPSEWAKQHIKVNNDNVLILPHGYDPKKIHPSPKIAKQCFYASSPDRGLANMISAWPKVHEAHPDATLVVTYGGELELPGVITLGEVDEDTMNDIYRTSDIWCHPCIDGELYCMTGKKAQASGCIPVIIPTMALNETVSRGFKIDKAEDYAQGLIEVLSMPMEARDAIRRDIIKNSYTPTWQETTDILENMLKTVYNANK